MSDDVEMDDGEGGNAVENAHVGTSSKEVIERELNEKYPNRPHNHSKTLPFHELPLTLFNPLRDNLKKPTGAQTARKKRGPHGPTTQTPHEARRSIIERFISRWRKEVGNDIFPAFRLIIPEKDRERGMYGLKEKAIGKLLVRIMKIDKNSEDGFNLLNWKLPGQNTASGMAGDFAGRCYEIISKRPLRTTVGDMTIDEVNDRLDKLSLAGKEENQLPIMQEFYQRMNAEELMWLIRMILRQMKIGATEKTFLDVWHPDAETLFNVSSNLRRVCWELYDPQIRLASDDTDIGLMQCFQPQLAQFQMHSFDKMVEKMRPTDKDGEFWVEEKLDGERMQLHMVEDNGIRGGKRFAFWSRKAKDYTYLYGNGLYDDNSALTRHLKEGFHENVRNIILDGEMITWDPEEDCIVGFGTLKTAALDQQKNPYSTGHRPLFRIFDILYLNDEVLTKYTLRDRRKALEAAVNPVHRRLEIHSYTKAETAAEIEPLLRNVVAEASEGLVVKNPRSMYHLNERNDDWIKVKPEYMTEYGEDLDCVVVGGYYGSGRRGGNLSSFLCGLRVDKYHIDNGADPRKCYSFCKVGGGFSASDYQKIRHETDGKWNEWDPKNPPTYLIELAGGDKQYERPDVWIEADKSVVVSVKAASVGSSDMFRTRFTLRFPRFKELRLDKDWKSALSIHEFLELKNNAEKEQKEKQFKVDDARRKRPKRAGKKELTIAGTGGNQQAQFKPGASTNIFHGLSFHIMTESTKPEKKTKTELEAMVKHHGGNVFQSPTAGGENTICIADRNLVKVAALQKSGKKTIMRPEWLFHCIAQAERDLTLGRTPLLLPYEPRHVYFAREEDADLLNAGEDVVSGGLGIAADMFGDSFARDIMTVDEMRELLASMPNKFEEEFDASEFEYELEERGNGVRGSAGRVFSRCIVWFDRHKSEENGDGLHEDMEGVTSSLQETEMDIAANAIAFSGGSVMEDLSEGDITHVVLAAKDKRRAKTLRQELSGRTCLPRIVTLEWVQQSWNEGTLLDEERFAP